MINDISTANIPPLLDLPSDVIEWIYEYPKSSAPWYALVIEYNIPEQIITDFANCIPSICWWRITRHQRLSESFMRKFADRLDWDSISWHQAMSPAFIREFADRLNWDVLICRRNVPTDLRIEMQLKGYL